MKSIADATPEELAELEKGAMVMCAEFPHLICSETQGLEFRHWCVPCRCRALLAIGATS